MTGGYSDFVAILCANSDDADRGAPIGSGSSPRRLSFSCWRSTLRLGVSVVGVMVSMIRTQPHPLLLLLWAWLRMVWDLSVLLQHYAMTHCSTCNAYSSWCVHALGLVQSFGGFDFDLLLWSGMLWRLIWLYIAGLECFLHGSMQPESLAFVLWIWLQLSIGSTMDSMSSDDRGGFFHDMAAHTSTDYDEYCDYSLFHLYDTWQLNSHYVLDRALDFFFL